MIFKDWNQYDEFTRASVVNNNFPGSVDDWVMVSGATLTWNNDSAIFNQISSYSGAYQDVEVTQGVEYEFSIDIINGTIDGRSFLSDRVGNTSETITSANRSITFTPQNDTVRVYIGGLDGVGEFGFENLTLKPA